ncbi:N-acyl homoserine lactonase family protein [Kordiimonas pumila]|uniref:N-acyl homoserine lactonase family protein n=1 Tax=Kordiimonas pumila TaxID=2161677 RepID=A0ABV7D3J2_9PROT|nr:N-acyl homoserine lactonase family protein [Kordiimonas pumila]
MNIGIKAFVGLVGCIGASMVAGFSAHAEGASIKLYALDCGEIEMLDLGLFSREGKYDGQKNSAVDTCFLIRHPDGDMLWDTGLPEGLNALPEGLINGPFHIKVPVKLTDQLQELGMTPADIEILSISHSHFDHVGNAGLFARAKFVVNANEYDHMFRDEARADEQTFASYKALENAKTVKITDRYDVFGDGSVEIIPTPGHTPGHSSLLVRLPNSGAVLLTGDMYHLTRARELRTVPRFNTDPEQTLVSMDVFEDLAEIESARVVIQHEKADFQDFPKFPEYLD